MAHAFWKWVPMSLDAKLQKRLERALSVVEDHGVIGPRLIDDGQRLWRRTHKFLSLNLIPVPQETNSLELSCYALQLPFRQNKISAVGKLGRTNLKERAEQAAEMLVGLLGEEADETLVDRATLILHELPHRAPMLDESKLLADVVNLDDFGAVGFVQQVIQLVRQGDGLQQLIEGAEKRDQYGYWDMRMKDGFHFEPVRQMAAKRLENSRAVAKLLVDELAENQP